MRDWVRLWMRQARAGWKYCLSFRKRHWELPDYPIEIRYQQPASPESGSRWKPDPVVASIINWGIVGGGNSVPEALAKLESTFAEVKRHRSETGERMPRPGCQVPVHFAAQERVHAHKELTDDFIHRVLRLPWAWISDHSSLWDFHDRKTNAEYVKRIHELYGVDVSDIESANIAEILDRIAAAKAGSEP